MILCLAPVAVATSESNMSSDLNEFIQAQRDKLERDRRDYARDARTSEEERQGRSHDVHTVSAWW